MTYHFTPMQWKILEALPTYRYLTGQQMVDLNISKSTDSIRDKGLKPLIQGVRPILASKIFRKDMGGRFPYVVALNHRSIKALAEELRVAPKQSPTPRAVFSSAVM